MEHLEVHFQKLSSLSKYLLGFLLVATVSCKNSVPPEIAGTSVDNKHFITGSATYFTDSCSFNFECDCCSGEIFFIDENRFQYVSNCLEESDSLFGTYSQEDKKLTLLQIIPDSLSENGKEQVVEVEYTVGICDDKLRLESKSNGDVVIGIESR